MCNFNNRIFSIRIIIFSLALIWLLGIFAPIRSFDILIALYPFQKILYSNVCHQNEMKSFFLNDIPLLVCARCTGIYSAVLLSSLFMLLCKKHIQVSFRQLIFFSIPMLLDFIFVNISIYNYNKYLAMFTGALFGSAVFLYILYSIEKIISKQSQKKYAV